MKNLFLLLLFLFSQSLFAVGTVTITRSDLTRQSGTGSYAIGEKVEIAWVGDSSDGSVPSTALTLEGSVLKIVTNPGSTAPTDNYDMALGDPDDSSLDALDSALLNRDTANTEQVSATLTSAQIPIFLNGSYTFSLSNNSVNSADGSVFIYLE